MQAIESKNILQELKELRDKLDSIIETLEIMADEELMESIKRGMEQAEKGEGRDFDEFLEELGLSV